MNPFPKFILAIDHALVAEYFWVLSYQERLATTREKHRGHDAAFSYLRRVTENCSPHSLQRRSAAATVMNFNFVLFPACLD